jgi:hypothetical protein
MQDLGLGDLPFFMGANKNEGEVSMIKEGTY